MLLFLFATLSVFLTLHDVSKNVFLVNQDMGKTSLARRSNGIEFGK